MTLPPLSDVDDFRTLVDLSPDAILAVDEAGVIVLANARTAQIFGYAREELLGADIELLVPAQLHELHKHHRREYATDPRTRPMGAGLDLVARRKNGSEFPAEISLSPMTTSHGRFVIAVVRDVTERKQVAAALKESREWLDAIFQASRDGIIVEEDERIVYANQAFARLYGYDDPGELLGQHVSVVQAGESNAWMLDLGRRRLAGEPVPSLYEFKGRRRDGRLVDLEASVSLSSKGDVTRIITVVRDISERKRVEEERARFVEEQAARRQAEAAQQRWAFLAEASAILSSSLDYETTLTTIARLAVPTLADWCSVDIVRDNGEIQALAIAHRDPEKMAEAEEMQRRYPVVASDKYGVAHAVRTGQPELYAEIPDSLLQATARDDRHLRILRDVGFRSAMIVPLVGRGRTLGAISLVSTDSLRRFGPSDLMFAEELASRAALAIDNARLYREAHEASQLKDEFLATLSHELRTPLNAMLGWARLLQAGELDEEATRKAIESIERNTQAQSQLVSDVLDVSRIIAGKLHVDRRPMEVAPVIDAAVDAIRPVADANGVELLVSAEPGPRISGDADRLRQVIWNLLSNAVKFTPRGGRVSIELCKTGEHVQIEVADTGIGIAADFLPFVFDRFRQADASTTRTHGGLGLGLAIVRHLVESHGGTVSAHSAGEGAGARFVVRLPAVELPAAPPAPAPGVDRRGLEIARKVQQSLKGIRVLVVDDEADSREVVRMTLKQYGATVVTASRVSEAMTLFAQFAPDAVVADIGLPGEDGYSFARRIRSLPREARGTIPLIALTAYARRQDRELALEAGFSEHLAKPVEPSELAWAVVSLVRRSQAAG